jgi:hypothetical protein
MHSISCNVGSLEYRVSSTADRSRRIRGWHSLCKSSLELEVFLFQSCESANEGFDRAKEEQTYSRSRMVSQRFSSSFSYLGITSKISWNYYNIPHRQTQNTAFSNKCVPYWGEGSSNICAPSSRRVAFHPLSILEILIIRNGSIFSIISTKLICAQFQFTDERIFE